MPVVTIVAIMTVVVMAVMVMSIMAVVTIVIVPIMSIVPVVAVMVVPVVAVVVMVMMAIIRRRRVVVIAAVIGRGGVGRGARIVGVKLAGVFVVAAGIFVAVGIAAIGARRGFDLAEDRRDLVITQQGRIAGAHLDQHGGQVAPAGFDRFDENILAVGKGFGRTHVVQQVRVLRGKVIANLEVGRQGRHADAAERGRQY
jgi:hypothetical protein